MKILSVSFIAVAISVATISNGTDNENEPRWSYPESLTIDETEVGGLETVEYDPSIEDASNLDFTSTASDAQFDL